MPSFEKWCAVYREANPDAKCDYKSVIEFRKKNPNLLKEERPVEIVKELEEVKEIRERPKVQEILTKAGESLKKERIKSFLRMNLEPVLRQRKFDKLRRHAETLGLQTYHENARKVTGAQAKELAGQQFEYAKKIGYDMRNIPYEKWESQGVPTIYSPRGAIEDDKKYYMYVWEDGYPIIDTMTSKERLKRRDIERENLLKEMREKKVKEKEEKKVRTPEEEAKRKAKKEKAKAKLQASQEKMEKERKERRDKLLAEYLEYRKRRG